MIEIDRNSEKQKIDKLDESVKETAWNHLDIIEKAIKKIENPPFIVCQKCGRISKTHQYFGWIYWIHCSFSTRTKRKRGYEKVEGFNIMPYAIDIDTVEKALPNGTKDFSQKIKDKKCDYDKSGNFHKLPDGNIQIVLTEGTLGPGWKGKNCFKKEKRWEERRKNIKEDYYFPQIDKPEIIKTPDDLKKLIETVLNIVCDE